MWRQKPSAAMGRTASVQLILATHAPPRVLMCAAGNWRIGYCAGTNVGSFVFESITEAKAVTRPCPLITFTVTRALYMLVRPIDLRSCGYRTYWFAVRLTCVEAATFESLGTAVTSIVAALPVTSAKPMLLR